VRWFLRSWFAAGLLAGFVLAVIELVALRGPAWDVVIVVLGLLLALGFVVAIAVWLPGALLAGLGLPRWSAAPLRALPALIPLLHLGRHLFDGAHAATLPGARVAFVWVPLVGYLAVVVAIAYGARFFARGRRRRLVVAAPLAFGAALVEIFNRRLFVSGYADLHRFMIFAACAALTVAIGIAVRADRWRPRHQRATLAWAATAFVVAAALLAAFTQGLASRAGRATVARGGTHARHLVGMVRAAVDDDGDGFSPILGGGDCDDGDPTRNPGAIDRPRDGIDQDCDGVDLGADGGAALGPADPAGVWRASPARAALVARTAAMSVVFLSIDALRADALTPADAPRLSALAARGVRFTRAFSTGAGTDIALGGVVTGRIDPWHGAPLTLLESIAASGRTTAAIMPGEVMRYAGRTILSRGLDKLIEIDAGGPGARDVSTSTTSIATTDRALERVAALAASGKPGFLWVHYFDPHEHLQILPDDASLAAAAGARDLASRRGKYAALLALADREIGRLLDGLAAAGLSERTIVVAFGDHGESMGEDPRLPDNHGKFVYDPLVRIPLIVAVPGAAPAVRDTPVSLLDLPATVLDLLDRPPLADGWGRSLAPLLVADAPPDLFAAPRALPLHESDQWGVVRWPLKLMVRPADNLVELYDLAVDPGERTDLAPERPAEVAALKAARADFPALDFDRTRKGRARREALARPPKRR
jgi:arylsulfatase A-like enzyme